MINTPIKWSALPGPLKYGFKDPDGTVWVSTRPPLCRYIDGWVIDPDRSWTIILDEQHIIGELDHRTLVSRPGVITIFKEES